MRSVEITRAVILANLLLAGLASAQILHIDPESINLGTMGQQESRDIQVVITNNGAALLEISDVTADCGCTVPTLSKNMLAPTESTVIDIHFDSKNFHGHVQKMVTIHSNDPNMPEAVFEITATVKSALLIDPASKRLGFNQSPVGTSATKHAVFTATEAANLEIRAEKSRRGLFDVRVENNFEGDPRKAALFVTVPEAMTAGKHRDNVRVHTSLPEVDYVDIDLSAWQVASLMASTDKINYMFKKDLSKTIHVSPQQGKMKFKVTDVTCDLPEIQIKVEELMPNQQTTIRLTGTAIDKTNPRAVKSKGRIKGTLTIHTTVNSVPTIEIPISYMVRM